MTVHSKIHLVHATVGPSPHDADPIAPREYLVRAFTRAGAEKFVSKKFKPDVIATVATQDQLVDAIGRGIVIEEAP